MIKLVLALPVAIAILLFVPSDSASIVSSGNSSVQSKRLPSTPIPDRGSSRRQK